MIAEMYIFVARADREKADDVVHWSGSPNSPVKFPWWFPAVLSGFQDFLVGLVVVSIKLTKS